MTYVHLPSCNIQKKSYARTVPSLNLLSSSLLLKSWIVLALTYSMLLCFYMGSYIFLCFSCVLSFFSCPLIVLSSHTNRSSILIFSRLFEALYTVCMCMCLYGWVSGVSGFSHPVRLARKEPTHELSPWNGQIISKRYDWNRETQWK